jgi:hypothetical protein
MKFNSPRRRAFLVACGLALAASGTLLYLGDARGATAAVLVAVSALTFAGAGVGHPAFRRQYWLGVGFLAGGLVVLGFPIGIVAGAVAGVFLLQVLLNTVVSKKVGGITLQPVEHPDVMAGAEDFVRQFSAEGFRVCGSYRFETAGKQVVLTVMAGPRNDRLAVVTDKVLQISSRFGMRSVVTTNSAVAPLAADVLRQHVEGGPVQLVRAHDAALTLLDGRSIHPDIFSTDTEALEAVREMEERALAFIGRVSLRTALRMETEAPSRARALADDARTRSRIDAWINA